VVFFGHLSYVPNIDGVNHFVNDIWPRIAEVHPEARCKIIGGRPRPSIQALAGPRVEPTGHCGLLDRKQYFFRTIPCYGKP